MTEAEARKQARHDHAHSAVDLFLRLPTRDRIIIALLLLGTGGTAGGVGTGLVTSWFTMGPRIEALETAVIADREERRIELRTVRARMDSLASFQLSTTVSLADLTCRLERAQDPIGREFCAEVRERAQEMLREALRQRNDR